MYKRYRMIYYLENGSAIQDIKEFYYRDREKMLERVVESVMNKKNITAIDSAGSIISIGCNDIVKVEVSHIN
ncbi:DUF3929 family protein [Ectobacillus panaciterrae]|uniref:DUF3929 family protein n=1 Tax=Ectobacillus panaciterrae TaxID=363872 RepID=UPI000421C4EB